MQRAEIESNFEDKLHWETFQKSNTISIITTFDLEDDWIWDESIEWQLCTAKKLYDIFNGKIEEYANSRQN